MSSPIVPYFFSTRFSTQVVYRLLTRPWVHWSTLQDEKDNGVRLKVGAQGVGIFLARSDHQKEKKKVINEIDIFRLRYCSREEVPDTSLSIWFLIVVTRGRMTCPNNISNVIC